jgi:S-formylglutathione hydrolase FrmB
VQNACVRDSIGRTHPRSRVHRAGIGAALVVAALILGAALPGLPADLAVAATTASPLRHGTVRILRMPAPSLGEASHSVRVYYPPSYFDPDSAAKRYPVEYLLHGWPGGDGNWTGQGHADETLDTLITERRIPELLVVMPNGNGRGLLGRSLYVNAADGLCNMDDFVWRDLVAWADSTLRTVPTREARGIAGLSDGGTGALNLAFRHPDVFSRCAGHSGDYHLQRAWDNKRIFGDGAAADRLYATYSPALYAPSIVPALHTLAIYFDVGVHDGELETNRELDRVLTRLGVAHTYGELSGGHSWSFWRSQLRRSLVALWGARP